MVTVRSFAHTTHQHLSSVVHKRKATSPYLQISTIKTEKKCSNTARDIERRLEVITMKMEDLKKLGVPCAFVHGSWRPTNYGIHSRPSTRDIGLNLFL